MILLKNDSSTKKNTLIVEFYLLLIALILTCLVNPIKLATSSSTLDEKIDLAIDSDIIKSKIRLKRSDENAFLISNINATAQLTKKKLFENSPTEFGLNSENNLQKSSSNYLIFSNFNFTFNNLTNITSSSLTGIDYIGYYNTFMNVSEFSDNDNSTSTNELRKKRYWALFLIFIPLCTIFGNILVVVSVVKEKNLHTVTNYFVVSLAIADLTVASTVMPFAVYYEVTTEWRWSNITCDLWVATDVMASTASILNLVAIAVDRFIAVTRPLKYAQHKNSNRIYFMIAFVWIISIAIASPILAGLNDTPDRDANQCAFNNEKFLVYSSIISFYIPTTVMIILYYRIFKVIRSRAKKAKLRNTISKTKFVSSEKKISILNKLRKNIKQENSAIIKNELSNQIVNPNSDNDITIKKTESLKNGTNNNEMNDVNFVSAGIFKLKNSKTPINPESVFEQSPMLTKETNLDEKFNNTSSSKSNENDSNNFLDSKTTMLKKENKLSVEPKKPLEKSTMKPLLSTTKPKFQAIVNQVSSNKERRVTKTLAIVVIVFLVCWSPFFAINNILKPMCKLVGKKCSFLKDDYISILTWLGYVNSFLNPFIYTIFNNEFRKAFEKIISESCCFKRATSANRSL